MAEKDANTDETFESLVNFVHRYLKNCSEYTSLGKVGNLNQSFADREQNKLTFEVRLLHVRLCKLPSHNLIQIRSTCQVVKLTRYLVYFGFFSFMQLIHLTRILLAILDIDTNEGQSSTTTKGGDVEENRMCLVNANKFFRSLKFIAIIMYCILPSVVLHLALVNSVSQLSNLSTGLANDFGRQTSVLTEQEEKLIMDTKIKIIEILTYVFDIRLDFKITRLLSVFKRSDQESEQKILWKILGSETRGQSVNDSIELPHSGSRSVRKEFDALFQDK